jgi:hypothetical protein
MTAQELQKRNERAQTLRVIQVDHDSLRRIVGGQDLLQGHAGG